MANEFSFTLQATKGTLRAGEIATPHGVITTPIFMPVGTLASVKGLDAADVERARAQILLANTYHLYLRPGVEVLKSAGGVHGFMQWDKPVLTDSGGFQVFSLGAQRDRSGSRDGRTGVRITDVGATFLSHIDGSSHSFTPEKVIELQRAIGSDIIMTFDECAPDDASRSYLESSLQRTHDWAQRCFSEWEHAGRLSEYGNYQALFGIIQGSVQEDLRRTSTQYITSLPFDGIAVGGETIGYDMPGTSRVMGWIERLLPEGKPRYAMGLGRDPQDLVDAVLAGFDMFDCVGPTRLARNGSLYVGELSTERGVPVFVSDRAKGRLSIGSAEFRSDQACIQSGCDCYTCTSGYSRSYLHHLYRTRELSYYRLASIHNVRFMVRLTEQLRAHILS